MQTLWTILVQGVIIIAVFSARSNSILDQFYPNGIFGLSLAPAKDVILIAAIFIQTLFLSWPLYKANKELEKNKEQMESVLQYLKEAFEAAFARIINKPSVHSNIRIFIPVKPWNYSLKKHYADWRKQEPPRKFLKIINVPGLAVPGRATGLSFCVDADQHEGLVGKCYNEGKIVWADDLRSAPIKTINGYNLTQEQKNKTCDVSFCVCVPVYNKSKVVAIVSYDSVDDSIKIAKLAPAKQNEFFDLVTLQSELFYQQFPAIFDNAKEGF